MSKDKILLAGESWETISLHVKGFDTFTTSKYEEGSKWIIDALEGSGFEVDFIPNHHASSKFPTSLDEIGDYGCVILSDIGANTLLLNPRTFEKSVPTPNRLTLIQDFVKTGGSFLMVGGYLSFQGIEGKANYRDTVIEEILPVKMFRGDDRVEIPEGCNPTTSQSHPITEGLDEEWPTLLGYNKLSPKSNGRVLVTNDEDPILTVGRYEEGRVAAFASDCAPHWGSPDFVDWNQYDTFWSRLLSWLTDRI